MAELLDGAPGAEAGVTGLALGAFGMVACVLVEWHGVCEVRGADDVAAAAAVVFAEVPCEVGLADGTCVSRLIGLPVGNRRRSSNVTILLINAVASDSAKTLAKQIKVRLLRRVGHRLRQVETNVAAVEAVLLARRWSIGCTRTRDVLGS